MSKIFKCLSLVLVLVMMLSMTTFAASVSAPAAECDKATRTVEVSGSVNEAVANQQVVILVLKSTANLESVSDADIAYIDQIATDAEGKFAFDFVIDESKGDKFTAYIGGTGVATPKSVAVNFGGGPGDCNGDDVVNIKDYDIVIGSFGKKLGQEGYDSQADLEVDDMINIKDYDVIIGNFGNSYK